MKKIFLLTLILICFSNLNAQQWALQDGGTNNDEGTSIIADNHGHIYTIGYFSSSATFGITVLNSAGFYDGYLTKYDTSGNFIWAKKFGGTGSEFPFVIEIDANENIVIAGSFQGSNITQIGAITITTNYSDNYFVAEFDSSGNVIWAIGNEGYLTFNDIAIDKNNNIDLIGTMGYQSIFGTDTIIPYYDATMGSSFNSSDIILVQYTSAGILNWAKKAGGYGTDFGNSITTDANNNIYITGSIDSIAYFDTILQNTTNSAYGSNDAFISKLDIAGNILWVNNYGGVSSSAMGERIKFLNNKLFFAGHFTNTVILGQDTITGSFQSFVSKLDTLLNFSWSTKSGGAWVQGLDIDVNENIFFTGVFNGSAIFGSDTLITNYNNNTYTSKINSNGLFIWSKQGGGKFDDNSKSLCLDQVGNAYITGSFSDTASFGAHTLIANPYYKYDIFIVKYSSNESPNGITKNNFQTINHFSVFPNPTTGIFTIQSKIPIAEIEIIDLLGVNIYSQKTNSVKTVMDLENLAKGIYLIRITLIDKKIMTSKLVIKD